jgi:hypothetical protein
MYGLWRYFATWLGRLGFSGLGISNVFVFTTRHEEFEGHEVKTRNSIFTAKTPSSESFYCLIQNKFFLLS